MGEGGGKAAISQAISGRASRAASHAPSVQIHVDAQLDLQTEGGQLVFARLDGFVELSPGQKYAASVCLFAVDPAAGKILIRDKAEFWLSWDGPPVVTVFSDRTTVTVDQVSTGSSVLGFTVDIAASAHRSSGKIRLHYASGATSRTEALLDVEIGSQFHAPPSELDPNVIALDTVPDSRIAFVYVVDVDGKLSVTGYHPQEGVLSIQLPQPSMSLVDVDDEQPSRKVYETVDKYSRTGATALTAWIKRLLQKFPDELSIVIVEHVDSHVPWEMLTLDKEGRVLGACALVTRWTRVQLYSETVPLDPVSQVSHEGRVLKFLDKTGLQHTDDEEQELNRCAAETCDSLDKLRESFEQLPADVALVFLACHGIFARDGDHCTALQTANVKHAFTTLGLAGLNQPDKKPAMIVNACHSARLVRGEFGIEGFPEFFLATFARSFLGTLGAVDDHVAGSFGAQFLSAARTDDGVRIAQFLRQLRKQAVDDFKKDKSLRKYRKYVSTFMYVFYGSSWDRMKLDTAP